MSLIVDRISRHHRSGLAAGFVIAVCLTVTVMCGADDRENSVTEGRIKLPPRTSASATDSSSSRKSNTSSASLLLTIASLGVMIGGLGLASYFMRPYLKVPRGLPVEALELLGRRAVEQKVSIHLVRCGHRVLVLSVSPEGARTLSEISEPTEVQRLVDLCRAPRGQSVTRSIPVTATESIHRG